MKKVLLSVLVLVFSASIALGADFYVPITLDYSHSAPSNVQAKVFKCADSSCRIGTVSGITTEIFTLNARSCFGNLNLAQMNACVANHDIVGDKAPSNGLVVKFTGVVPNVRQDYLVVFSANADTYIVRQYRVNFQTSFSDYDYSSNVLSDRLNKISSAKAEVLDFTVLNADNPELPIQVNVRADMDAQVCSAYEFLNNIHRPSFDAGYSDYSKIQCNRG